MVATKEVYFPLLTALPWSMEAISWTQVVKLTALSFPHSLMYRDGFMLAEVTLEGAIFTSVGCQLNVQLLKLGCYSISQDYSPPPSSIFVCWVVFACLFALRRKFGKP